ncbi:MAG TPA: IS5 family transposase, partial [Candidatus Alectryocaccomicrobium excrementavium]|nr:IS5 family transposase [Candidatus Alectryocaccomicrobium excrementavium]
MENSYRRHDMSDAMWEILKPYTIGNKGTWGGNAKDTRQFLNGVFWILRTGAPWRDLPPEYGKWNTVQRRFCRWRDKGIWEKMLEAVIQEPDFEWLMIDASHIKVHPHASGAPGGNQDMARNKRGLNTKIHLAVDAHGMPIRFFVTAGTIADCTQACALIDGVSAEYLLADRGYDSRRVIEKALRAGTNVVIPPRKNRKEQRDYDRYLYKLRHLVENAFLHLKRWRGIATRYAKLTSSFV